jgi:hypothetical protein
MTSLHRLLRSITVIAAFLCVGIVGAEPAPPVSPAAAFRITGVVLNSVDGSPVPHCHLSVSLEVRGRGPGPGPGPRRQFPSSDGVDADEHGRFSLSVSSAGSWQLTATALGYVSQAYDQHENYSSAVVLTNAAPVVDLVFRLPPESSIRGEVRDEANEAVRNARVGLLSQQLPSPGDRTDPFRVRAFTQTDDRGMYEFANLPPGRYRVMVEAKPWYANTNQSRRFNQPVSSTDATASLDPSLDMTYQLTWFPGVGDALQAETLALRAGDDRRADFHLVPIPAVHLRIVPPPNEQSGTRTVPIYPVLERMDVGVPGNGLTQSSISTTPQGQIDVGGLSPGLYRVRIPEQNSEARSALVEVTGGSTRVLDFNAAASATANVTVHLDGADDDERVFGVELTDPATGQRFSPFGGGGRPMPVAMRRGQQRPQPQELTFQVPPGRYEVNLLGRGETYLTGVSAPGADVVGRFITVHEGDVTLTLHTASGRAMITGIANFQGAPSVGAMVLLIPAGLDDPSSFTTVARDQTNTDGSFELQNVVPGQYILLAIDRGWNVNWKDPSTLTSYLTQGVPLDIRSNASLKQNIDANAP